MKASELDEKMVKLQEKWTPNLSSGKTRFKRMRKDGQGWTDVRDGK